MEVKTKAGQVALEYLMLTLATLVLHRLTLYMTPFLRNMTVYAVPEIIMRFYARRERLSRF